LTRERYNKTWAFNSSTPTLGASGSWYADAVNWAASNGIVAGYGNGLFGPNDEISREQMAVILYNYTNSPIFQFSKQAQERIRGRHSDQPMG
jgi:hypothetical protein